MYCFEISMHLFLADCVIWDYHELVFLAHDVLFEISLTNFWSLINTSQCVEFNLLTIDFDLTWLLQLGNLKNNVTGWRSQIWWQLLSASIWYQSLGWWWLGSMSHVTFFSPRLLVRKWALSYFYRSIKRTKDRLTPLILASSKETVSRFPRELESV